jgi:hypothetical protein
MPISNICYADRECDNPDLSVQAAATERMEETGLLGHVERTSREHVVLEV